jgi:Mn-dependent DtxR family transcriptional regulator
MSTHQHSPLASAYFRFLQLVQAIESLPAGVEIDANESALLETVVLRWHQGQPMTVREAISQSVLGSPATLHKRITRLRQKELLDNLSEAGDRRAKFLIPTQRTLDHFHQLGQSMQLVHAQLNA